MNYLDQVPEGQRERVAQAVQSLKNVAEGAHEQAICFAAKELEMQLHLQPIEIVKAVLKNYESHLAEILREKSPVATATVLI